jgi:4-amino-4-deoxy-L-arabinose transferase-like glycosyltransferase
MSRLADLTGVAMDPRLERRAMLAILALAALLRLVMIPVVFAQLGYLPDILSFRSAAADLWAGRGITNDYLMPGYPVLVLLSGGVTGQLATDLALSLLSVWCVGRIAREIAGDAWCGLLAALLWAVYPFSIFYSIVGLSENFYVALVLLGFLAYQRARFFWGSVAMVAAIMTRPAIEILVPILIISFALPVHRLRLSQALKHLAIFAAIYVVSMSPWWWHNYNKYGQFVRLNLAGGIVLYSGNYPGNRDGGGVEFSIDVPGYHDIKDPVARDRVLRAEAVRHILDDPRRFLELAQLKFLRLWRPWPYASDYSSPLLTVVSAASYLPLLVLAIAGVILGARRYGRQLVPIALFIGYTTAVHMITIGSLRYRFPMEPFLAVLAAPPLARIARRVVRPWASAAS